jgi:DNA-binding transcriptional regulator YiaG
VSPKRIRTLRGILGLTQQQLADFIGASQVAVARWETGVHKPTGANLKLLKKLADKAAKKREREKKL